MVKYITERIRPDRGFSHFFHLSFVSIVPIVVFVFIRLDLVGVALAVILMSKWRMLSVKPRYWLAHIRTNSVDLMVSLSILIFMTETGSFIWQLFWVLIYELWILFIKPGEKLIYVSAQAILGQLSALTAIFLAFPEAPLSVYMLLVAVVAYFSARHFFGSFDEPHAIIHSAIWAILSVNIMWVLGHWLVFAGPIAMPAVVLCALGFSFAGLYYLRETDRLKPHLRKQIYAIMFAIMAVLTLWLLRRASIEL
jgi:hypothetical protein